MSARDWRGLLPREHGSWAYVLGPQFAAILGAPLPRPPILWMIGSLLLFGSFQGFAAALRRRERWSPAGAIAGMGGGGLLAILSWSDSLALLSLLPTLLPVGLGLLALRGRLGRQTSIEIVGIVGAAVVATGGLYLGGGSIEACVLLSIPTSVYFLLGLIWIRLRLSQELPGRSPVLRAGWNLPAGLGLLLLSATCGLLLRDPIPGFLPGIYLARVLLPAPRDPSGRLRIVGLGIQEIALAALFSVGLGLFLPR